MTRTRAAAMPALMLTTLATLALAGCGGQEDDLGNARASQSTEDLCADSRAHVSACFGAGTERGMTSCDRARAERLLDEDCSSLTELMLDPRGAGTVEERVRREILNAIREAIVQGVRQGLQAALDALGADFKDLQLYLVLGSADSEVAAVDRAAELALLVDGTGFQPTPYRAGDHTFYILQGPCPLDLSDDLARLIAELVLGNPKLLEAITGGEVTFNGAGQSGEATVSLHLPLKLLPVPSGTAALLGCGK